MTIRRYGCGNNTHKVAYYPKYDLFGCETCDRFTEEPCNCEDGTCHFEKAPAKPSLGTCRPDYSWNN